MLEYLSIVKNAPKKTICDVENPSIVTVREVTSSIHRERASDHLSFAAALREMRLNTSMQSISSNYQRSNLSSGNLKCICQQRTSERVHHPIAAAAMMLLYFLRARAEQ
jgi:hypothetical protein